MNREIFNIKDKQPDKDGHYLVFCPKSFPKNSKWVVAEYDIDAKGFYSESSDLFLDDVIYWCELPNEKIYLPKEKQSEETLRTLFRNNSDCYADSEIVMQAMTEEKFVEVVSNFLNQINP